MTNMVRLKMFKNVISLYTHKKIIKLFRFASKKNEQVRTLLVEEFIIVYRNITYLVLKSVQRFVVSSPFLNA